jgi:hypothetical protein
MHAYLEKFHQKGLPVRPLRGSERPRRVRRCRLIRLDMAWGAWFDEYWLRAPGGVDVLRFSSLSKSVARVIDVYSMGRRWEGVHSELLKAANRSELFYLHDTVTNTANSEVYDVKQHRDLYANTAKRSKYFVVAPAKIGGIETGGQVEIGYRYFEGAAAGAVIIGVAADCEAYTELFSWPEVVVEIQPDGSDIWLFLEN